MATIIRGPSLFAQTVENLPAMQETRVQSLVRKIPWRREWLLTLLFLPGECHGQMSLAGYSPQGCKKSDMTEQLMLTLSIEAKVSMQVCGSNSSLLGIYHKELKSGSQKVICTLMFITALFTITKV